MAQKSITRAMARFAARRPWTVITAWALLLVAGIAAASAMAGQLSTGMEMRVETESSRAEKLLEERLRGPQEVREFVLIRSDHGTVLDEDFRDRAGRLLAEIVATPGVVMALNYYESLDSALLSDDQATLLIPVVLSGTVDEAAETVQPLMALLERYDGRDGFSVVTGGEGSISRAFTETAEKDLRAAEIVGLPIALVVLVVVFGALVAAGVPIVVGMVAIAVSLGITALIASAFELSIFTVNMITMTGLAVGIDYSLLIVQRFREERRSGRGRDEAIERTGATASRAVLFSGMTVVVALFSMFLVPSSLFQSVAAGAVIVVIVAVAAALTLLPALLRLLGDRVNLGTIPLPGSRASSPNEGGFWARTASFVMKRRVASIVASVALLLVAGVPYLNARLGFAGVASLPESSVAYRAFSLLDSEFSAGLLSPADIVIDAEDVHSPEVAAAIDELRERLFADPNFSRPMVEANEAGDLALVTVAVSGDPLGSHAIQAVERLRSQYIPAAFAGTGAEVSVGGETARDIDYSTVITGVTPVVLAFVLGLSFLILLVIFRSVVVPLKAILMNLLSVGAAYGVMTLVFQQGVGAELLGFRQVERIESWVPLFMFAMLFGLSMDYHVFLLTRIREHFDATGDNAASVRHGVQNTAGMITGAALIMVAVFGGFAMGELTMFQQMGFGLAVAVILDATIIRTVLVPASMALLGDLNWYLPPWLKWLPKVHVEGAPVAEVAATRRTALEPGA
ncbi:MAG: MMPL family transporter [Dehalococcoidia bacterium]|nr:MMPL family transporter [Chloroflexi bacterium CFX7]MCK6565057.1 MMPL family transporter [Dehalococcoidia bacterium]NUQ56464.1 MMPL family transporter [Dehalococcoidia bacterium]RIL01890.1 MAG: MMPL family transporter [bacterium]